MLKDALLFKDGKCRQGRGATERIGGVRMAVEEGLELLIAAEESVINLLRRQRGGQR